MTGVETSPPYSFSSNHAIQVLVRPEGADQYAWRELDLGPGYFRIEPGFETGIRIRQCDDGMLRAVMAEAGSLPVLTHLNLSENRKVSDAGVESLAGCARLRELNLSSCDITNDAILTLKHFPQLEILNLSFCPRINDTGLRAVKDLRRLVYLDLQGCPRITRAGLARIERPGLEIHKHK